MISGIKNFSIPQSFDLPGGGFSGFSLNLQMCGACKRRELLV